MKKRIVAMILFIAVAVSMFTPCAAAKKADVAVKHSNSSIRADGSVLAFSTLENGNLLITLTKDNVLLESTEVDFAKKTLLVTSVSEEDRITHTKEVQISSLITYEKLPNENSPIMATSPLGPYKKFGKVSFRGQIGIDYFSTPSADVYVRQNSEGPPVLQTVKVKGTSTVTEVLGLFSSALGAVVELTLLQEFLIALGIFTVGLVLTNAVDYVDLRAVKYGESIKAVYNGNETELPEGYRIVATGEASNGKYANKTFYSGACEQHVRDCNINYCHKIYDTFFRGYGTLRGMSFREA